MSSFIGFQTIIIKHSGQILDELIIAGELQESSKKSVLRVVRYRCFTLLLVAQTFDQVAQADAIEDQENSEDTLARLGSRSI